MALIIASSQEKNTDIYRNRSENHRVQWPSLLCQHTSLGQCRGESTASSKHRQLRPICALPARRPKPEGASTMFDLGLGSRISRRLARCSCWADKSLRATRRQQCSVTTQKPSALPCKAGGTAPSDSKQKNTASCAPSKHPEVQIMEEGTGSRAFA